MPSESPCEAQKVRINEVFNPFHEQWDWKNHASSKYEKCWQSNFHDFYFVSQKSAHKTSKNGSKSQNDQKNSCLNWWIMIFRKQMSGRWRNKAQNESICNNHRKEIFHFYRKSINLFDAFEQIHVFSKNDSIILLNSSSTLLWIIYYIFLAFLWISSWRFLVFLFCEMKVSCFLILNILKQKCTK